MARPAGELLEFDKLVGIVLGLLTCGPGRRALEALRFSTDRRELEAGFSLIGEAVEYLASGSEMGFGAVADPEPWLEELGMPGSVLDPPQLIDAAALIEAAYDARQTLAASRERWPLLAAAGATFVDLRPVAGAIRRALLPSG